jgi:hypothetical protein
MYGPGQTSRKETLITLDECNRYWNGPFIPTQTIYPYEDISKDSTKEAIDEGSLCQHYPPSEANDAASQSPASECTFISQDQEMAGSQSNSNHASPDFSYEQTIPIENPEILIIPKKEPRAGLMDYK